MGAIVEDLDGVYLITGPARLTRRRGSIEVFSAEIEEEIVVPAGRSIPVLAHRASAEIHPGPSVIKKGDKKVYEAFKEAALKVSEIEGRILLVGPTDSGKSTLAAWVASLKDLTGSRSWLMTVDVGQNEVYAPGFEAVTVVKAPYIPGWSKNNEKVLSCFVGSTSPTRSLVRYFACAAKLARGPGSDYLIIDTDGWIELWDGIISKSVLAEILDAEVVFVGIDEWLSSRISGTLTPALRLPRLSPRSKSREERRLHRERLLTSRLIGSKKMLLNLEETMVIDSPIYRCKPVDFPQATGVRAAVYAEECQDGFIVVARHKPRARIPGVKAILEEGWERGLIIALDSGEQEPRHHLAVIERINYKRKLATLHTTYEGKVEQVIFGRGMKIAWPPKY